MTFDKYTGFNPICLLLAAATTACTGADKASDTACGDNAWFDGNDCIEFETEVCDDGLDNDGNGSVDCADDGCMGAVECPTPYSLEVSFAMDLVTLGTGSDFDQAGESPSVVMEGSVQITGVESEEGDWFVDCTGTLGGASFGDPEDGNNEGGLVWVEEDEKLGQVMDWNLFGFGSDVEWEEDCMVLIPSFRLALDHGSDTILVQDDSGAWEVFFTAAETQTTDEDTRTVTLWSELVQAEPYVWEETY